MAGMALLAGCSDFLDCPPSAVLSDKDVTGVKAIEGLVISSYASFLNARWDRPMSLWPYMVTRSDDAYKGGKQSLDKSVSGNRPMQQRIESSRKRFRVRVRAEERKNC